MVFTSKLATGNLLKLSEENIGEIVQSTNTVDLKTDSHTRPKISSSDETVIPLFVRKVHGTSSPDTKENKDLCGNTETEQLSDDQWHLTIEGILSLPQFEKLRSMNPQTNAVTVQTTAMEVEIVFDRFSFEEKDNMNGGQFSFDGHRYIGPLFDFQLQSKEK